MTDSPFLSLLAQQGQQLPQDAPVYGQGDADLLQASRTLRGEMAAADPTAAGTTTVEKTPGPPPDSPYAYPSEGPAPDTSPFFRAVGHAVMAPAERAKQLSENYIPGERDPQSPVGREALHVVGSTLGVAGPARAASSAASDLGAAGGKLFPEYGMAAINDARALKEQIGAMQDKLANIRLQLRNEPGMASRELSQHLSLGDQMIEQMQKLHSAQSEGIRNALGLSKEFDLGALGGSGASKGHPPVTALVDAFKKQQDPEFEKLANSIYRDMANERGITVAPTARNALANAKPGSGEAEAITNLAQQTAGDRLGETAERAAAWQLYQRRLGGNDFELGAFGSAPRPTGTGRTGPEATSAKAGWTGEQSRDFRKMAEDMQGQPAKEIIRAFREKHGDVGPKDENLVGLISRLTGTTRATGETRAATEAARLARHMKMAPKMLDKPEIEALLIQEAATSPSAAHMRPRILEAMGLPPRSPAMTAKQIEGKLRELQDKGRLKLYSGGPSANPTLENDSPQGETSDMRQNRMDIHQYEQDIQDRTRERFNIPVRNVPPPARGNRMTGGSE